jgi:hypothetical protein
MINGPIWKKPRPRDQRSPEHSVEAEGLIDDIKGMLRVGLDAARLAQQIPSPNPRLIPSAFNGARMLSGNVKPQRPPRDRRDERH